MVVAKWIVDDDELTGQHVKQHGLLLMKNKLNVLNLFEKCIQYLIIVCVSSSPFVVWTQHELLHDPFNARIYIACQIGRRQIPGDESGWDRHHVSIVVCDDEIEYGKLMSL